MSDDADPGDGPASAPDLGAQAAVYANHLEVGYNAFEFLLEFGQSFDETTAAGKAARIVTAPAYAKVFCGLLQGSIVDYESNFGPIPSPPPDPPET
jgi:hypothetical protein